MNFALIAVDAVSLRSVKHQPLRQGMVVALPPEGPLEGKPKPPQCACGGTLTWTRPRAVRAAVPLSSRQTQTSRTSCMTDDLMADPFARAISGALKQPIDAHGPITTDNIGSATKRLSHALREVMKEERDRIAATQPRRRNGEPS